MRQASRGPASAVDLGLLEGLWLMNCPLFRGRSLDTLGVLGFTGSRIVNVDPLPAPSHAHQCSDIITQKPSDSLWTVVTRVTKHGPPININSLVMHAGTMQHSIPSVWVGAFSDF